MGIRNLTYLDIPLSRRQESANKTLARLRERRNDPFNSPELMSQLDQHIARLEQWAAGTLPEGQ